MICSLDSIYSEFERVIERTSAVDDLTWFSQHHGKDMPRLFPQYEVRLRYHNYTVITLVIIPFEGCDVIENILVLPNTPYFIVV